MPDPNRRQFLALGAGAVAAAQAELASTYPPGVPPLASQRMPVQEPGSRPRR